MISTPLRTYILELIRGSGPITFERYMALCLNHPEFGYYMQGSERTGVRGDYFTSADLHPIFARLVARQAAEMWGVLGRPSVFTWVEMGAGRGLFARDFLVWAARALPDFFAALQYCAIEPSEKSRARLCERLRDACPETRARVVGSLEELPALAGCFFSNELVDAFPVSLVTRSGGHLKEIYVTVEGEELREKLGKISDPAVAAYVARYANQLDEGHRIEVNLNALRWMRSLSEKLARGFVITIDYGDFAERLYTQDRSQGTLMAYHGHRALENPFMAPGEMDLTSHVNFSALIDEGKKTELEFAGFVTQEQFLMALGEENQFADLYDSGQTELEKLRARLQLKRLLDPGGMGNVFRVLVQRRGAPVQTLTGFKYTRS